MSKFKSLLNWLKNPKMWFVILYLILSIALITASIVVVSFGVNDFWAYLIYSLTAVDVIYLVYLIIYYVPKIRQACLKFAYKNRLTKEYVDNFGFRSLVSVSFSFAINGVYALFLAVMSIISGSYWYGALAIYYFALTLIRGGILFKHVRRRKIDDENTYKLNLIKSYRNCGIYLSLLTLALSGAIVQMVISNQGFRYAGTMIYLMALYAFYKLIKSIVDMTKAKRNDNYTTKSIRCVRFVDALVSILALQTAMFQAFAQDFVPYLPNSLTGGAVCLIIVVVGIIMIVNGNKQIKKFKTN